MTDVTRILNAIERGDTGATYIGRVAKTFKFPMENSL
jgi:hypothetical protein